MGISENNIVQKAIKKGSAIELTDLEMADNNLFSYWQKQKDLKNIDEISLPLIYKTGAYEKKYRKKWN